MKNKIALACKGINPASTNPMAQMLKFQSGNLISYGGTFCVQIPCQVDLECVFKPSALANFFRKNRSGVSYSVSKGKMIVKHKRERVTIPVLDSKEMPIIDVINDPVPVKFPDRLLVKQLLSCVDPSHPRPELQGVHFNNGLMVATNGRNLMALVSGVDKEFLGDVPYDTLHFINSVTDDEVVAISHQFAKAKFHFKSGMTVCTNLFDSSKFPGWKKLMNVKYEKTITMLTDKVLAEIVPLKCEAIAMNQDGFAYFNRDDKYRGEFKATLNKGKKFAFVTSKDSLIKLLSLTKSNKIYMHGNNLHAEGEGKFKFLCSTMQYRSTNG